MNIALNKISLMKEEVFQQMFLQTMLENQHICTLHKEGAKFFKYYISRSSFKITYV